MDVEKLTKERDRAVKREEKKAGIKAEWFYRVQEGSVVRWFKTDLTFYPKVAWWVQEYGDNFDRTKKIGGRIKLTDELKQKLEDWL